jgi:hypothetical protein
MPLKLAAVGVIMEKHFLWGFSKIIYAPFMYRSQLSYIIIHGFPLTYSKEEQQ